ncbi:hypothetical protein [Cognatishimia sp.]|uniref:hypothetical protein n=1 Tax=Cognatishimia sp. TaxID=2211648 RepID=UPI0035115A03|nr:hypothetical protein [Cognatishimia sp.]
MNARQHHLELFKQQLTILTHNLSINLGSDTPIPLELQISIAKTVALVDKAIEESGNG